MRTPDTSATTGPFAVLLREFRPFGQERDWAKFLWVPVILAGLMGGCSSGAHSTASRPLEPDPPPITISPPKPDPPIYLAQATCWNTMSCCIQNNPLTFVENCGADPLEAARILSALTKFIGKAQTAAMATQHEAQAAEADGAKADDFANNADLPEWKQACIRNYVACQSEPNWKGPCYACLRRCEGQQDWPFGMCWPPGKKGK